MSLDFGSSINQDMLQPPTDDHDFSLNLDNSDFPINETNQNIKAKQSNLAKSSNKDNLQKHTAFTKIKSSNANRKSNQNHPEKVQNQDRLLQNSLNNLLSVIQQIHSVTLKGDSSQNKLLTNIKSALEGIHGDLQSGHQAQTLAHVEFKGKVRKRIQEFKQQKKAEMAQMEEATFKKQISEFELRQKVSGLEEQVSLQQDEINKQANANEILKFEKMRLIQKHQKSLATLGTALQEIQVKSHSRAGSENANKISKIRSDYSEERGRKRGSQRGLNAGRSQGVRASDAAPSRAIRSPNDAPQSPTNHTNNPNEQLFGAEPNQLLSRSFQANLPTEAPQILNISNFSCDNHNQLQGQPANLKNQLDRVKQMVAQFQISAKEQKNQEEQIHAAFLPNQNSMSDIDFCADQKLTNNLLRSSLIMQEADDVSNDANRAVIIAAAPETKGYNEGATGGEVSKCEEGMDETNVHSFCGDLEKQLNDTSSFAGNHLQENNLPDNLNQCFFQGNTPLESERKAMGKKSLSDLDQIENLLLQDSQTLRNKGKANVQLDSAEKEIDDLFSDSQQELDILAKDNSLQMQIGQTKAEDNMEKIRRDQDVNLDDVLRASVATEIQDRQQPCANDVLNSFMKDMPEVNDDLVNQEASFDLNMQDEIQQANVKESENQVDDLQKIGNNPIDLSSIIFNDQSVVEKKKSSQKEVLDLDIVNLSAIEPEISERNAFQQNNEIDADLGKQKILDQSGSENLEALNRGLMPNFVVNVGQKQIKMPLLDIDRVVYLEDRSTFKGNIASQKSLATDTILQTQDAGISQTSGGSFLNDSSCKQLPTCLNPGEQEAFQTEKSIGDGLDNLNVCDQALSAILNAASQSQSQKSLYKNGAVSQDKELLASLRDQIEREEAQETSKLKQSQEIAQSILSPSNSMPFEMRQSHNNQTDSGAEMQIRASDITILKQSVITTHHNLNQQVIPTQNDSQKRFNRLQDDSQAMRLSELDSVLPAGLTTSQGQTQNVNFKERSGMQAKEETGARARAPSEGFARGEDVKESRGTTEGPEDAMRILSEATPTYVCSNSGTVISALGNKTRLSAPVNLAPKRLQIAQNQHKSQLKAEDVVKEADNEDSRLILQQTDTSQSRIVGVGENDKSWETGVTSAILAYNNAYPRTTKSLKLVNSNTTKSNKHLKTKMSGEESASTQEKLKGIRNKLNDASKSVVMRATSNSGKNNGSSSQHKLKIVKRSSINSVVRAIQNSMEQASVSAERPQICENSRTSIGDTVLDQSDKLPQNSQYDNVSISYNSSHQPNKGAVSLQQSKANRKSGNSRKTMPIMVNIKNIVRQQKEEQGKDVGAQQATSDTSVQQQQRSNSGPRKNIFNLQKLKAAMQNQQVEDASGNNPRGNSVGKSSSIRSGLNISIIKGRVVRDRENSNPKKVLTAQYEDAQKIAPDREGSMVYIGGRKSLIDPQARLQNQRPNSLKPSGAQENRTSETVVEQEEQARQSSVTQKGTGGGGGKAISTKVLLAAAQNMRKRKLSIGSQQQMKQIDGGGGDQRRDEVKLASQSRKNASSNKIKIERVNVNQLPNRVENSRHSKPTSPKSPLRKVSKVSLGGRSTINAHEIERSKERVVSKVPNATKKTNIINIKKRGHSKTKDSNGPEMKQSATGANKSKINQVSKTGQIRGGSLGPQEESVNDRNSSANLADFPALKIKRISRSKTGRGISQNSKKVASNQVKVKDAQHFQSVNCGNNLGNITSVTASEKYAYAEHHLTVKDQLSSQQNQNNTLLEDYSILSKLNDPNASKPQVVIVNQKSGKIIKQSGGAIGQNSANQMMTNLLQQNSSSNQRLVNQSSLHNLAQKFSSAGGITLSAVSASSNSTSAPQNTNQSSQNHHPLSHSNKNLQTSTAYSTNQRAGNRGALELASKSLSSHPIGNKKVNIQLVKDSSGVGETSLGVGRVLAANSSELIDSLLSVNNNANLNIIDRQHLNHHQATIIEHQNSSLGDFAPNTRLSGFSAHSKNNPTNQHHPTHPPQKQVQVSSKALKAISNKKSQLNGAKHQVQLEWKTPTAGASANAPGEEVQYQQQRINQKHKKQM